MRTYIGKYLSSFVTTLVLLLIYACALAIATFIEKYQGTATAKAMIYYSPLLFLLQALLIVNFVAATLKHRYLKRGKWGLLITHFALIVILLGALTSFLFGKEGTLHLREGESSNRMVVQTRHGYDRHEMPFSVELKKFTLTRYPGSVSPSSYESKVIIHLDGTDREERIYMNRVLDVKGYRFFQASYDPDEQGTVLSVNRDVAGRSITYSGYFLLLIGLILCLVGKDSRFMRQSRRLKKMCMESKAALLLGVGLLAPVYAEAREDASTASKIVQIYTIPQQHAALFGALPMQSRSGRMMPVNTFSSEILRKLHKANHIGTLNSDQFLLSLLAMPDVWIHVPFIALSNAELAHYYGLTEGACAYIQVFDENGDYKLQAKLEEAYNKMPAQRSRFDKDLIKLDEQLNTFNQLINRQLLNLFPREDDAGNKWYAPGDDLSVFSGKDSMFVSRVFDWYLSEIQEALKSEDWAQADRIIGMIDTYQQAKNKTIPINPKQMQAELSYNRMDIFRFCKIGYLVLGGFLLVLSFARLFHSARWINISLWCLASGVAAVFLYHMFGMGMRWYIGGYAPWSNSYETMVYVGWATLLGGFLFVRRSTLVFSLATLFGGIILFVSGLSWMDPEINPLVPVLKSPWLMFHVAVIVAAYGFFGISCLIGLANMMIMAMLGKPHKARLMLRITELSIINELSAWIGLILMTIGTFLGAIWANESWGRYWGWDPKETWALITMVIYAVVCHLHLVKRWNSLWLFNLVSVMAFASVLMTFFGVNFFLSGMHSYGQNEYAQGISTYLYIALGAISILAAVSYRKWIRQQPLHPSSAEPRTLNK